MTAYTFEHAIKMLKQAIEFGEAESDYSRVRVWAHYVEEAHNAEIETQRELTTNANEGAHLMYMYGQGREAKLLQDWDLPSGTPEYKEAQQVADKFNFDTVAEQEF